MAYEKLNIKLFYGLAVISFICALAISVNIFTGHSAIWYIDIVFDLAFMILFAYSMAYAETIKERLSKDSEIKVMGKLKIYEE